MTICPFSLTVADPKQSAFGNMLLSPSTSRRTAAVSPRRPGDLSEADIPEFLPLADVVAITGTSITNHTFDGILNHLPKKSYNIVLGPSTPLTPLLFELRIDMVSGAAVEDYATVKKHVLQACPTRHLKGLRMISIMKEGSL